MFFEVPVDALLKFSSGADYQGFIDCVAQQAAACTGELIPVVHKAKEEKFQKLLVLVEDGLRVKSMVPCYHTKEEVRSETSLKIVRQSKKDTSTVSDDTGVTVALALGVNQGDRGASCDLTKQLLPVPDSAAHMTAAVPAADLYSVVSFRCMTAEQPLPFSPTETDSMPNPLSAPSEASSPSARLTSSEFFTVSGKKAACDDCNITVRISEKKSKSKKSGMESSVSSRPDSEKAGKISNLRQLG
ncbi:hypothetical protein STCU_10083 [Strigomonas culicis]|uniref:Uncharacterized protein n=1 Tax=Strigomonas culicis TaxID=28005 RepID=S9UUS8_9TRYP|nr:hypothetical protein STCU_10083 [Strigomonas culicis]|eukprot:EPY18276.1 hypothetical protein STCU_10083 [Strigomonas culicis]